MITSLFVQRMFTFILSLLLFFSFTISTFAQETGQNTQSEFSTSYDVTYDIDNSGVATITEKVTLKNLTSQYYANQFKITIGATQISDVKASDPAGPMEVKTETKDTTTTIEVKFNQQVAGLGKTLPWTLQFKSKDFAEKQGKVWEVRVPKISSAVDLESYNLTLSVPSSFGEPTLIAPTPKSQTVSGGKLFLTFDKEQIKDSGVSASFGTNQLFDFDLTYHLENSSLVTVLTNIALPPDTAYQDVIFQRIDPKPINVSVDQDGNYLAWYRLSRGDKFDVKVVGSAKLYTKSKVKDPSLSGELVKLYTSGNKYWETDNPIIKEKLTEILGENPPASNKEKAKLIHKYVVNSLKYDFSRVEGKIERFGAVSALNNPNSAICMEFTDLFITLTRAAGVPSRELDGFAYSANTTLRPLSLTQDILHAWPEYWDEEKGWVMIDPTWENTTQGVDYFNKLDLNHFVFAVKGASSQRPVPAGSYKLEGQEGIKDVNVTLVENDFLGKPQLDVKVQMPSPLLAGFPLKFKVIVSNLGNAVNPPSQFSVIGNNLNLKGNQLQALGPIPAFGQAEFEVSAQTGSLFDSFDDVITVQIGDKEYSQDYSVRPFVIFQTWPVMIGVVVGLMVLIYIGILGWFLYRRRLFKFFKK